MAYPNEAGRTALYARSSGLSRSEISAPEENASLSAVSFAGMRTSQCHAERIGHLATQLSEGDSGGTLLVSVKR